VPWSNDKATLVRNALAPLQVREIIRFDAIARIVAISAEHQTAVDDSRYGENIVLAAKVTEVDLEVMSREQFESRISYARRDFASHPDICEHLAAELVRLGFFSRDDLSVIDPDLLRDLGHLDGSQVNSITAWCGSGRI
jgi:N utilization substance protein A